MSVNHTVFVLPFPHTMGHFIIWQINAACHSHNNLTTYIYLPLWLWSPRYNRTAGRFMLRVWQHQRADWQMFPIDARERCESEQLMLSLSGIFLTSAVDTDSGRVDFIAASLLSTSKRKIKMCLAHLVMWPHARWGHLHSILGCDNLAVHVCLLLSRGSLFAGVFSLSVMWAVWPTLETDRQEH